ncbi:MAG: hypothetical protein HY426_03930 [Candidatus Levybacteria bacterium]|nr:hypothetical protein [Candidatus Levybacteria bacterium]
MKNNPESERPFLPEEPEVVPVMDPVLFRGMPDNFGGYSKSHPEILPDYLPFAGDVLDLVDSTRPDQIIALTGPQGIGKTRLLVPAILRRAQERGYKPLGSIQLMSDDLGGSRIMIDAHEWQTDKGNHSIPPSEHMFAVGEDFDDIMSPGSKQLEIEQWDTIRAIIHRKFTSSDEPKLFIIDEFSGSPLLFSFISELARTNNVRLVAIGPIITKNRVPSDEEREDIRDKRYQHLHEATNRSLVPLTIPDQLVPIDAIPELLKVFGIDEEVTAAFSKNPHLRRLAMLEEIVKYVFAARKREAPEDDTLIPWESLDIYGKPDYWSGLGLTEEEFNTAQNDLFKKAELETSP